MLRRVGPGSSFSPSTMAIWLCSTTPRAPTGPPTRHNFDQKGDHRPACPERPTSRIVVFSMLSTCMWGSLLPARSPSPPSCLARLTGPLHENYLTGPMNFPLGARQMNFLLKRPILQCPRGKSRMIESLGSSDKLKFRSEKLRSVLLTRKEARQARASACCSRKVFRHVGYLLRGHAGSPDGHRLPAPGCHRRACLRVVHARSPSGACTTALTHCCACARES